MFHLFPSVNIEANGIECLVNLDFVYLQVRRVEQFSRVCAELSEWGSVVNRSGINCQNSLSTSLTSSEFYFLCEMEIIMPASQNHLRGGI